jgi:transposase
MPPRSSPPPIWPPTPASPQSPALRLLHQGRTPATGNRKLERAFFLSAFAALHDPASRTYYDRKRAQGKKHNAALICLARRRCDVLFAMLHNKTYHRHPEPTKTQAAA